MAQLTVQPVRSNGVTPTFTNASAGGDSFLNDGYTILRIRNTSASAVTVTAVAQSFSNHGTRVNETITIPATTGDIVAGFFQVERFNDLYGQVQLTYSAVSGVSVAVLGGRA